MKKGAVFIIQKARDCVKKKIFSMNLNTLLPPAIASEKGRDRSLAEISMRGLDCSQRTSRSMCFNSIREVSFAPIYNCT